MSTSKTIWHTISVIESLKRGEKRISGIDEVKKKHSLPTKPNVERKYLFFNY